MTHLPTCQTPGTSLKEDCSILSASLRLPGALDFTREENTLGLCCRQKMGGGGAHLIGDRPFPRVLAELGGSLFVLSSIGHNPRFDSSLLVIQIHKGLAVAGLV